jgi:cobalt-precorrin 5A hydrolase
MIAAGIGCRSSCNAHDIVAAVHAALAQAGRRLDEVAALYAPALRQDAAALPLAAAQLAKPLRLVAHAALLQHSAACLTHSERVLAALGVPSIAETAALAGADAATCGANARLLGPRVAYGGATCALATVEEP